MNRFLVTYGPVPQMWCLHCREETPLVAARDGVLRPGDVELAQRNHACERPEPLE